MTEKLALLVLSCEIAALDLRLCPEREFERGALELVGNHARGVSPRLNEAELGDLGQGYGSVAVVFTSEGELQRGLAHVQLRLALVAQLRGSNDEARAHSAGAYANALAAGHDLGVFLALVHGSVYTILADDRPTHAWIPTFCAWATGPGSAGFAQVQVEALSALATDLIRDYSSLRAALQLLVIASEIAKKVSPRPQRVNLQLEQARIHGMMGDPSSALRHSLDAWAQLGAGGEPDCVCRAIVIT